MRQSGIEINICKVVWIVLSAIIMVIKRIEKYSLMKK